MRRINILAVFLLCVALLWAALPATDSFNNGGANVLLTSYSGSWTVPTGSFQIIGNGASGYGSAPALAYWNADTFSADQYAKGVMTYGGMYGGHGIAVRVTAGNGYYLFVNQVGYVCCTVKLGRLDAGTRTVLTSIGGIQPVAGDTLQLDATGSNPTTIRATMSRSTRGDIWDTTYTDSSGSQKTAGNPGLYSDELGSVQMIVDSWEGGNVGAAAQPSSTLVKRRILR